MTIGSRIFLWLLATAVPSVLQGQEFKGPIWGGSGGTASYDLDCGSAGVMVGVFGKVGSWIDALGVTCQRVNADGSLGSSYTRGTVGGSGGDGKAARCGAGKVIGGLFAWSGSYINILLLHCFPWSSANRRPDYSAKYEVADFGTRVATYSQNMTVQCPTEKVGKAIRGKYGWYIDSAQFVCDDYNK